MHLSLNRQYRLLALLNRQCVLCDKLRVMQLDKRKEKGILEKGGFFLLHLGNWTVKLANNCACYSKAIILKYIILLLQLLFSDLLQNLLYTLRLQICVDLKCLSANLQPLKSLLYNKLVNSSRLILGTV